MSLDAVDQSIRFLSIERAMEVFHNDRICIEPCKRFPVAMRPPAQQKSLSAEFHSVVT
jgi:hypothetical protein